MDFPDFDGNKRITMETSSPECLPLSDGKIDVQYSFVEKKRVTRVSRIIDPSTKGYNTFPDLQLTYLYLTAYRCT